MYSFCIEFEIIIDNQNYIIDQLHGLIQMGVVLVVVLVEVVGGNALGVEGHINVAIKMVAVEVE